MLLQIFVYLQLLDFVTTILGFQVGASEASPFIRILQSFGPTIGLALSKGLALSLGAACIWLKRERILGLVNYWYAGLVVWNLCIIAQAVALRG